MAGRNLFALGKQNILEKMKGLVDRFLEFSNQTFYHPNVKKLFQSNASFDAVIMEEFSNDALKVFSYIYGCPLIILGTVVSGSWINPAVANPQPVSYVPQMLLRDFSPNSLLDRTRNLFYNLLYFFLTKYYTHPKHEEIMHKAFPDAPPLYDLYINVSLVLLNSHISYSQAVPSVPNMVEIGGYFIDPPQKLSEDLQDFLDNANYGVVYFSMGSSLKSTDLSDEKKKILLAIFRQLKQKVLWKFEEDLPGKPSNVMIRKWLPQQDILAHPNIKLFINHGGLLSIIEAICHGVPVLAMPVFGDHYANAQKAVDAGMGLRMDYLDPDFSEENFGALVNEMLQNQMYKENAQQRSKIYHDRPQKSMETAVYWIEYVIRHNGAKHLRVAGVGMPWYKYFMVDVIALCIFSFLIILYCLNLMYKSLRRKITDCISGPTKLKIN